MNLANKSDMPAEKLIIKTKNLCKTYHSGDIEVKAIENITLNIKVGEFIMITGRNGSGKSTLLHQLGLLDYPDSGTIHVHGKEVTHLSERIRTDMRLRKLGYIFQEYALAAELSALENVMLPSMMVSKKRDSKKQAMKMLKKVMLDDKWERLPSQLSGGEKQKIAIARALVNNPDILIADEPTANLDTVASKDLLEIIKNLNKKEHLTVVMVTHEPEELHYASRHIKLSDGKIV